MKLFTLYIPKRGFVAKHLTLDYLLDGWLLWSKLGYKNIFIFVERK